MTKSAAFDIKDVQARDWQYYGASARPLYISIYPPLYTRGYVERYGMSNDIALVFKGNQAYWFMTGSQMTALAKQELPRFLKEQWGVYDLYRSQADEFEAFHYAFMKQDVAALSDADLRSLMQRYREAFSPQFLTNNVMETISYHFQHELKGILRGLDVAEERADHLMHVYGLTARKGYLRQAYEAYAAAKSPFEIQQVIEKYHYIITDYMGPKTVTEDVLKEQANVADVSTETADVSDVSEEVRAHLAVLQVIATLQDLRKAQLLMMVVAADRFGKEFAKRSGVPFEDIQFATWEELETAVPSAETLTKRRTQCFMYWDKDGALALGGDDSNEIAGAFDALISAKEGETELKGVCASRGTVTGPVVVVTEHEHFGKVKPGDVLVTTMTRPEYLPIMGLAAAFVCDEGGITSHAAIVAREMKKPCVIATKSGTRFLKDGDMVEVDANAGIVKKI